MPFYILLNVLSYFLSMTTLSQFHFFFFGNQHLPSLSPAAFLLSMPKVISFMSCIVKSAYSLSTEPGVQTCISLGNSPNPPLSTTHRYILSNYLDLESQCFPTSSKCSSLPPIYLLPLSVSQIINLFRFILLPSLFLYIYGLLIFPLATPVSTTVLVIIPLFILFPYQHKFPLLFFTLVITSTIQLFEICNFNFNFSPGNHTTYSQLQCI